jgi:hypothetical protein
MDNARPCTQSESGSGSDLRSSRCRRIGLLGLYVLVAAAAGVVSVAVPLMPEQNDSAWYYMNVHHSLTGEYVWEGRYPSFSGPSLYYPRGGYSLSLYISVLVAQVVGVPWPLITRAVQFLAYAMCAGLVFGIGVLLGHRCAAPWAAAACLLYFPLFNFAHVVMSETLATWLVLLACWLCMLGLCGGRTASLYGAMAVASYATLYKPVLLMAWPLLWTAAAFGHVSETACPHRTRALALALLLTWAPLAQAAANYSAFGRFQVQGHTWWHLWDRVIAVDGSVPTGSPQLAAVTKELQSRGERLVAGYWWEFVAQLSRLGYSPDDCDRIVAAVVRQGLAQHWPRYLTGTVRHTWSELTIPAPARLVLPALEDYRVDLLRFGAEDRQHVPLAAQLLTQRDWSSSGAVTALGLGCYSRLASASEALQRMGLQYLLVGAWTLWIALVGVRRYRHPDWLPALMLGLLPLAVALGSAMTEYPEHRHRLPVEPIIILAAAAGVEELAALVCGRFKRQGGKARRGN